MTRAWPPPLRHSVPALLLLSGLALAALSFWQDYRHAVGRLERRAVEQIQLLGTLHAADLDAALRRGDLPAARAQVVNLSADRLLRLAALVDDRGVVAYATRADVAGSALARSPLARHRAAVERARAAQSASVFLLDEGRTAVGVFPVTLAARPGEVVSRAHGALVVERDISLWRQESLADAVVAWRRLGLVIGLLTLASWGLFTTVVTRRAERLVRATEAIAGGESGARPVLGGGDELAAVSRAVARMAQTLAASTERLRRREATFRRLLEHGSDVLTIVAADGTVDFVSPSVERVLGYPVGDMTGASLFDYVHPEDRARVAAVLAEATHARGRTAPLDFRLRHGDGSWRQLEAIGNRPADWPEESLVVSARDVTHRQHMEEQLRQSQKMEAVGRLAGGIAHDFNNLLTVIRSYTDMVLEQLPPGSPVHEDAEEVRRAADRAAELTRQLLVFSRRGSAAPNAVALCDVVREMQRMVRRLVPEHVTLLVELAGDSPVVRVDATQLEQVLMNLVVNAWDAMPRGGTLRVACDVMEGGAAGGGDLPPGRWARLMVSDTGHGMDAATRARLFEPFFTTKERGKGTGLGLSTVYAIVAGAGGHVSVESEPGAGTTFQLLFPASAAPATPAAPAAPAPARGAESILLVEDEDAVRRATERLLRRLGYQVISAPDGERALEIARGGAAPLDLLVTDVVMPRLGGVELAALAREGRPDLPVLYISGYTADAFPPDARFERGTRLLAKPFTTEQLAGAVRALLDGTDGPDAPGGG